MRHYNISMPMVIIFDPNSHTPRNKRLISNACQQKHEYLFLFGNMVELVGLDHYGQVCDRLCHVMFKLCLRQVYVRFMLGLGQVRYVRFMLDLDLCQVYVRFRLCLGQVRVGRLGLCQICVRFMLGLGYVQVMFRLGVGYVQVRFMLGLGQVYVGFMLGLCYVMLGVFMFMLGLCWFQVGFRLGYGYIVASTQHTCFYVHREKVVSFISWSMCGEYHLFVGMEPRSYVNGGDFQQRNDKKENMISFSAYLKKYVFISSYVKNLFFLVLP